MNKILLFLSIFLIGYTSSSQMVMVPNQPLPKYYNSFNSFDGFYFLNYIDQSNTPGQGMYTFNGENFDNIPFPNAEPHVYLGRLNDSFFFVEDIPFSYEVLLQFDGQQVIEIPLPTNYTAFTYSATFNNKIYFGAQESGQAPVLISYDGASLETISIPGVLLDIENSHYSSHNNLLYLQLHQTQIASDLWAFNGQEFTIIEPPQDKVLVKIHHEFEGMLLLEYYDTTTTDTMVLYKYDGTLTEIENPVNTSFFHVQLTSQENKIYVTYYNLSNYDFILYKYDYQELISVSSDYQYDGYGYFATFDEKDIFAMNRNDGTNMIDLIAYDGTSLTPITGGPENFFPRNFAGIANNKMYLVYADDILNPTETVMVEYVEGASSVNIVPGMPQDKTFFGFVSQIDNKLFYQFRLPVSGYYFSLYAFDGVIFREIEIPDYDYSVYEFTFNDKLYASCYQGTDLYKLFSLNPQNLEVEEVISANSITVFPNPVSDDLKIKFSNIEKSEHMEISVFSIDGKLIDQKKYMLNDLRKQITYSTSHLSSGVYLINFKTNFGAFQKKIIKK